MMSNIASQNKQGPVCLGCQLNKRAGFGPELDPWFVYRSDRWTVNHRVVETDNGPALSDEHAGWFVAQPRVHVTSIAELDSTQLKEFGVLMGRLTDVLEGVLGVQHRVYVASLGVGDTHVHFHFVPVTAPFGPEAITQYSPKFGTAQQALDAMRADLDVSPQQVSTSERGLSRVVESVIQKIRSVSPYHLFRRLLSGYSAMRYLAAEIYTISWFLLLLAGIVVGSTGPVWVSIVAGLIGALRLLDIGATQTGILLYESRSSTFAGVQSIARSVLLALINLAEVAIVTASWTLALARIDSDSFSDVTNLGLRSVLDSLQPLGGESLTPLTSGAQVLDIVQISIMFYVTVVLLGGVLGNIGAQLSGETNLQ